MSAEAAQRRMKLYYMLRRLDHAHLSELAKALDVSISTIRLDIACLQEHHPIVSIRGRNGCFKLLPDTEPTFVGGLHWAHIEVLQCLVVFANTDDVELINEVIIAIIDTGK